ncbi:membrane fusion protein [Candidatus Kinetoplastibacterium desouzaii TCC079E]|uniref:Membrane fusion protein n=1 Tax=Candidatus Kinetoplastidibacterium desouzai TCC079E TaxID=1208919 RepID=M1LLX5_9PROT|nr:efflux RND transporter periplasmic adaptor subunit [Candidatus Kinetoplastibacterium desouzaii]AGF46732.1 membrane fusion protein [Candidatus Kinetoplastibacterium desouzaii TCC079E]
MCICKRYVFIGVLATFLMLVIFNLFYKNSFYGSFNKNTKSLVYQGLVSPASSVDVVSRVSGVVNKVNFQAGDKVVKGQMLFKIDDDYYKTVYQQKNTNLKKAENDLISARKLLDKYKLLVRSSAISQHSYEEAISSVHKAEYSLEEAKIDCKLALLNLNRTEIKSPVDGFIGQALVSEGSYINIDGFKMAKVQQLDPVYIDISTSIKELSDFYKSSFYSDDQYKKDIEAVVILKNHGEYEHIGEVVFVDRLVDVRSKLINLRIRVANPKGVLLPGELVEVRLNKVTSDNKL